MSQSRLSIILLLILPWLCCATSMPSRPKEPVCFINNNSITTYHIMRPNFLPPDTLVGGQCGQSKSPVDLHHYSGGRTPIWIAAWQGSSSFIKRGEITQPKKNHSYDITDPEHIITYTRLLCRAL